jgi:hypothetical protein
MKPEIQRIVDSGKLSAASKESLELGGCDNVDYIREGTPTALFMEITLRNFDTAAMLINAGADIHYSFVDDNTGTSYTILSLLLKIWYLISLDQDEGNADIESLIIDNFAIPGEEFLIEEDEGGFNGDMDCAREDFDDTSGMEVCLGWGDAA